MSRISQRKIDEVKQAADIVDVIGEFVSLQSSGKSMKGLCPFHNEKTPSFHVSKERQLFNCFGCGEKGDVFKFVSLYKRLNYVESIKFLADKYNIELDFFEQNQKTTNLDRYFRINELAKQFFNLQLLNLESGNLALNYLKSRNLDEHTLNYFEVGYAPKSSNSLWENLSKDYHDFELINLGLVNKKDNDFFDVFRNRVIFPIHNEHGKVLGFSGRTFDNDDSAKYINSTQTDLFNKSEILYNLDKAIPFITRNKRLVLMEGFFDVISAHIAGVKECVCSMGTALTVNQAQMIKSHTDNVVICYDGDDAGVKAAYKALFLLNKVGLNVRIALLPEKMDPDEYIKKNSPESFRNLLKDNLYDQYDFVYQVIVKRHDLSKASEIESARISLFEYLHRNASSTIREIYLKKFGKDIDVSYNDLLADYHYFQLESAKLDNVRRRKELIKNSENSIRNHNKAVEAASKIVINYFVCYEEARDIIKDKVEQIKLSNPRQMQFLYALIAKLKDNLLNDDFQLKRDFVDITEDELKLFKKDYKKPFNEQEITESISILIEHKLSSESDFRQKMVSEGSLNSKELEEHMRKIEELQNQIRIIRRNRNGKKANNG